MNTNLANKTIGVFGGAGPLASAHFVNTLYKMAIQSNVPEQQLPIIFLHSNPSVQDRTASFLAGEEKSILNDLEIGLQHLIDMGADKIILCCYTLHYILPIVKSKLKEKIISLPEALLDDVINYKKSVLLLRTIGSKELRVFEGQANWYAAKKYIIELDDNDQTLIHKEIYKIKRFGLKKSNRVLLDKLLDKYNVNAWAAGCTEFHLFSEVTRGKGRDTSNIVDPLLTIASRIYNE